MKTVSHWGLLTWGEQKVLCIRNLKSIKLVDDVEKVKVFCFSGFHILKSGPAVIERGPSYATDKKD